MSLGRSRIIAILNVTPDSFSDGGRLRTPDDAVEAARRAVDAGADALDVGGESTRPGAERVSADQQSRRVVPAIDAIRQTGIDIPISVDTTLAAVARAALDVGADAINDVSAGQEDAEMFALAADRGAGLILMHRRAPPMRERYSDQLDAEPDYGELGVVEAVRSFLAQRAEAAISAGVSRDAIAVDPGVGFGKSIEQNLALIRRTDRIVSLGYPVVAAASRKSFIGRVSGVETPDRRVFGSIAATAAQRLAGASLFRVHDVAEHAQALKTLDRIIQVEAAR